jgi:hypothetical protein
VHLIFSARIGVPAILAADDSTAPLMHWIKHLSPSTLRLMEEFTMGAGIEAVRDEIHDKFEVSKMQDRRDEITDATVISFAAEGRNFAVSVSDEFDRDYDPNQFELSKLAPLLRSSKDRKATVRRGGISA